ncbi:hypothetical protein 8014-B2_00100 [Lactobacillus phage ATCC 8014-B2]|uniref:Uncharacterized protein n=1 Tax=Lactobacillus phage ATCC 8014-B2 TaxID=1225795 RepID=K4I234_9CAUD|nr:hypothetical protein HOQ89_gp046 [Lactobacillus phage ATCC 8014-B2]AFU63167.1 hypothetical protein 8014-B2_00100 [Lactobacillus phage ATCC 8014-B2]
MKMSFEEAFKCMKNGGAVKPSTWYDDTYMMIDGTDFVDNIGNRTFLSYKEVIAEWEQVATIKVGDQLFCRDNDTNKKVFFYIAYAAGRFFAVNVYDENGDYYVQSHLEWLENEIKDNYTIVGNWNAKDLMEDC